MRNIKSIAVKFAACAAVCLLTLLGSNFALPGTASAEQAVLPIGVVDYGQLINRHPDTAKANEQLQAEREQEQKDFNAKSVKLSEQDKQNLGRQLGQQFEQKRQELAKPIIEKINAAIKEVMEAKGLSMVVQRNTVIFGGQDITQDVLQKIGAN
ncbi:MAG: OmpH family outer membrane protein [Pelosinus sp.]|nr:OmpH family outer membrane protein [Pelosinus sp.]